MAIVGGEEQLIGHVRAAFARHDVLGHALVDDAAALPPVQAGAVRVVTTDVAVEGVDFRRGLYPLSFAGCRAIAQNLSDLAASGAVPTGFVWSLTIPQSWSLVDVMGFVEGAALTAGTFHCPLLGGDLSSTPGAFSCAVTAFGDVQGAPHLRTGARPGDAIYVSGALGASAAGLRLLQSHGQNLQTSAAFGNWLKSLDGESRRAVETHLEPTPQLELGTALVQVATAAMDVSDGLLLDLNRLTRASGVAADLDALESALDPVATQTEALMGGEDFALLWTAPAGVPMAAEGARRIGWIVAGEGIVHRGQRLSAHGFDHFAD